MILYNSAEIPTPDIISRVADTTVDIPFRPRLAALDTTPKFVVDVIKECWDEDQIKRPDFKTIRNKLKPLQKGMWVYYLSLYIFCKLIHLLEDVVKLLLSVINKE